MGVCGGCPYAPVPSLPAPAAIPLPHCTAHTPPDPTAPRVVNQLVFGACTERARHWPAFMLQLGKIRVLDTGACKALPLAMDDSSLPQWLLGGAPSRPRGAATQEEAVTRGKEAATLRPAQSGVPEAGDDTPSPAPSPLAAGKTRSVGIGVKHSSKPSRWRRDKARMEGLEQRVAEQALLAKELEQEQQRLRLRNVALEHCIASRDWQVSSHAAHACTAGMTAGSCCVSGLHAGSG